MNEIELQLPVLAHEEAAKDFINEFFEAKEKIVNGSAMLDQMDYKSWLTQTVSNRLEETVKNGWVSATTFFAVRKCDGKIIGMIDIRHNLNNEFLARYGGHIGYSVRPSERRKGYATQMLEAALKYAKSLGINKVMLSCFSKNIPSAKMIEKCGGRLTETKLYDGETIISNSDGKTVNIYWLDL